MKLSGYMGLQRGVRLYALDADPPLPTTSNLRWATQEGELDEPSQGDAITYALEATTDAGRPVTYTIKDGSLPDGLTLARNGTISGTIAAAEGFFYFTVTATDGISSADRSFSFSVIAPPEWFTDAGTVGAFAQGETFQRSLIALSPRRLSYAFASSTLPDTIAMETVEETALADFYRDYADLQGYVTTQVGAPTWITPKGSLGVLDNGAAVVFDIQAAGAQGEAIVNYGVVSTGRRILPAGAVLTTANGIGQISGFAGLHVIDAGDTVVTNAPTWTTPAGSLGTVNTGDAVSYLIQANGYQGQAIVDYSITSSGTRVLPVGVTISTANGVCQIAGPASLHDAFANEPFVAITPAPTWTTPAGDLGSSLNGATQTVALAASPPPGATTSFTLLSGALPGGMVLTDVDPVAGTAQISGKIDANPTTAGNTLTVARTFTFVIRVVSSNGSYSDREFSYTINVTA